MFMDLSPSEWTEWDEEQIFQSFLSSFYSIAETKVVALNTDDIFSTTSEGNLTLIIIHYNLPVY